MHERIFLANLVKVKFRISPCNILPVEGMVLPWYSESEKMTDGTAAPARVLAGSKVAAASRVSSVEALEAKTLERVAVEEATEALETSADRASEKKSSPSQEYFGFH